MANVFDVANFFVYVANQNEDDQMTNLKLNKLLYFAQGAFLSRTGRPLFSAEMEAWPLGPVVPEIYQKYKICGKMPIQSADTGFDQSVFSEDELEALLDVMREYGQYTGSVLVTLTHQPGTPWRTAADNGQTLIPKTDIARYFKDHPVHRLKDRLHTPKVTKLPSDWYHPEEDAEWEGYL